MGDRAESDAWYSRLTVLLARCVAAAAVMDLAHYRSEHTGVRPYRVMLKVALVQRGPISGHFLSARDIAFFTSTIDPRSRNSFFVRGKLSCFRGYFYVVINEINEQTMCILRTHAIHFFFHKFERQNTET